MEKKGLSNTEGGDLEVMFIPNVSQLHHPEFQYINQVIGRACREFAVPFVDMTPIFEHSQDVQAYYLWPQDPHVDAVAHLKMAEVFKKVICAISTGSPIFCGAS